MQNYRTKIEQKFIQLDWIVIMFIGNNGDYACTRSDMAEQDVDIISRNNMRDVFELFHDPAEGDYMTIKELGDVRFWFVLFDRSRSWK